MIDGNWTGPAGAGAMLGGILGIPLGPGGVAAGIKLGGLIGALLGKGS